MCHGVTVQLIYLYDYMPGCLLENVGFVEAEGESIQIPSRSKSITPFCALLIYLRVL